MGKYAYMTGEVDWRLPVNWGIAAEFAAVNILALGLIAPLPDYLGLPDTWLMLLLRLVTVVFAMVVAAFAAQRIMIRQFGDVTPVEDRAAAPNAGPNTAPNIDGEDEAVHRVAALVEEMDLSVGPFMFLYPLAVALGAMAVAMTMREILGVAFADYTFFLMMIMALYTQDDARRSLRRYGKRIEE